MADFRDPSLGFRLSRWRSNIGAGTGAEFLFLVRAMGYDLGWRGGMNPAEIINGPDHSHFPNPWGSLHWVDWRSGRIASAIWPAGSHFLARCLRLNRTGLFPTKISHVFLFWAGVHRYPGIGAAVVGTFSTKHWRKAAGTRARSRFPCPWLGDHPA